MSSGGGTRGTTSRGSAPLAQACRRRPCWPRRSATREASRSREVPQRAHPEPGEEQCDLVVVQRLHGKGREETGGAAGGDDAHGRRALCPVCGVLRGEHPVGDAGAHVGEPCIIQRPEQGECCPLLSAVEPCRPPGAQHGETGAQRLHAGGELFHDAHGVVEGACVARLVRRYETQLRARRLCVSAPLAAAHSRRACRGRACDDASCVHERDRIIRIDLYAAQLARLRAQVRRHGPVGEPQRDHALRNAHDPTARSAVPPRSSGRA